MAILILLLLSGLCTQVSAFSSFHFLKASSSVRELSLSGAGCASTSQGGSFNPSGVSSARASYVYAMHGIQSPDLQRSAVECVFRSQRFSYGLLGIYSGDDNLIPADEDGHVFTASPFGWKDIELGLTAASRWNKYDWGITVKAFHQSTLNWSRRGVAVDAGMRMEVFPEKLHFGISVLNAGRAEVFISDRENLPLTLIGGTSYIQKKSSFSLEALADYRYLPEEKTGTLPAGFELGWKQTAFLSTGYPFLTEHARFSLGAGIKWQHFRIHYSLIPAQDDFSPDHFAGLSFRSQ